MEVIARVCTPNDDHVWMIEGRTARVSISVARALKVRDIQNYRSHISSATMEC